MSHQPELSVTLTTQEARALVEAAQALGYNLPGLTSAVKKLKLAQAEQVIATSTAPVHFIVSNTAWAEVDEQGYRL